MTWHAASTAGIREEWNRRRTAAGMPLERQSLRLADGGLGPVEVIVGGVPKTLMVRVEGPAGAEWAPAQEPGPGRA